MRTQHDRRALPRPPLPLWRGWRALLGLFTLPSHDPDLARSQFDALSHQIPVLYAVLMVNALLLAATHFHCAPLVLTAALPVLLLAVSVVRLVFWRRTRRHKSTDAEIFAQLRLTVLLAGLVGLSFTVWGLSLYPYGGAMQKCHVAFYIGVTVISCIFYLMHLRAAALLLVAVVVPPCVLFFLLTGQPVLMAMAVNMAIVSLGMARIMLRNYADFSALILSKRELTRRQRETQRLSDENLRMANLDTLSSLPNRRRFFAELQEALTLAQHQGRRLAVGLLDLDRFKGVNDIYGHAAGDRLLTQVALRLKRLAGEHVFVARLGGDEFGVILSGNPTEGDIFAFGARVKTQLQGPCVVGDRLATVSCSIGVACYPQAGSLAEDLFERADYALYYGKLHRKGEIVLFSEEHETVIRQAGMIEQALRLADLEAEMWVAFQPIVDVTQNRIIALEALARWRSHELGPLGPDAFIPIAERSQLINSLTAVLLTKTLEAMRSWPVDVSVCFNLSAQDLISARSMGRIREIVLGSGIAPSRIEFEVTETAVLQDFDLAAAAIDTLHALGVRISLDDFGTGFSSLSYVHRLPLDKIKIDRSFVADVDTSRTSPSIIKTIVALCRNLGLTCVVEGVETQAQLEMIVSLGCTYIQGYLLSPPVEAKRVPGLIGRFGAASRAVRAPDRVSQPP